jgi:hypothetical protein
MNKNKIQIAVHIRRGRDITNLYKQKSVQGIIRWADVSWYKCVLDRLVTLCGPHVAIEIFSDSHSVSELSVLQSLPNTHIHLAKESKRSAFDAFQTMVAADIVVCGLSSFSYFAASLSDGIKIVPPSKIQPYYLNEITARNWIFPDKNANFDSNEIYKYLLKKRTK